MSVKSLQSLVCLTEESVETLYLLGREDLIKGVSVYVRRPEEAQKLPKVTSFIKANYKKISEINPDLIIGFSDIQKDIARDLIELGHEVYISNQRTIKDILSYIYRLSLMIDEKKKGLELIDRLEKNIERIQNESVRNIKVYFEEWDEPRITAIRWVSELISLCGGVDIFEEKSFGNQAKDRYVTDQEIIEKNPDIILGCWCGKPVQIDAIKNRLGYEEIKAVKSHWVFELAPEIFLQPGPAPILEGLDQLLTIFKSIDS